MNDISENIVPSPPKVFISYSHDYQKRVKEYVDRLISEGGIDAIVDFYDLDKGHDLNVYMEKMVNDNQIEFVLMFCTKAYMEKANSRKGGVGTESLIISQEVYNKVTQTKFIPVACEIDDDGEFTLPTFVKSRNAFDFTTPEKSNEAWEELIRFIHKKPRHQKPQIGTPPSYVLHDEAKEFPEIKHHLTMYKHAIHQGKIDANVLLARFLNSCLKEVDGLRVREAQDSLMLPHKIVEKYLILKKIRNRIVEWLEFEFNLESTRFPECIFDFLEHLLTLKVKPIEMTSWNDCWFDAHKIFLHDLFVYIIASLNKNKRYDDLKAITEHQYLVPEGYGRHDVYFGNFSLFYGASNVIGKEIKISDDQNYISPTAELFKRNSDIAELPFDPILMESELLLFMISILKTQSIWIPWSLLYCQFGHRPFPLFLKATQHRNFEELKKIFGVDSADSLRRLYKEKITQTGFGASENTHHLAESVWSCANMERLDTL